MISFDQARRSILEHAPIPTAEERIPLGRALGRVLARAVHAESDLPPFDKAMMDGYAVRSADLGSVPVELELVGVSRAGCAFAGQVGPGQAVGIMTGAALPPGADAVVVVERAEAAGEGRVRILAGAGAEENILRRGGDLGVGARVLERGTGLRAAEIAALAIAGCSEVPVVPRPRVLVLATGDEIVPPGEQLGPDQVRDVNTSSLVALLGGPAVEVRSAGSARDEEGELEARIRAALEACDVLVLSGGVSMGRYDLVAAVLLEIGVRQIFHKVRVKPGKPLWFGRIERSGEPPALVFGLPGNPVSAFAIAATMVRPALARMCAQELPLDLPEALLEKGFGVLPNSRLQLLPAVWRLAGCESRIRLIQWTSSGDVVGLAPANAFAVVPPDSTPGTGEVVRFAHF